MNEPNIKKNPLKVIQVVHSLHPNGGGVTKTVTQLSDRLADQKEISVEVLCQQSKDKLLSIGKNNHVQYHEVDESSSSTSRFLSLGFKKTLQKKLIIQSDTPTVIHNNGLWLPVNHWAVQVASKFNIPIVTQPHGALEPWALENNKIKKKIAFNLYQKQDLLKSNLLLATAESERQNLRALGFSGPIAVLPNGIEFPQQPVNFTKKVYGSNGTKTALFLSRIHKKKGLINLVQAWSTIRPKGWRLKIVGPDENNHLDEVKQAALTAGIIGDIDFLDPIDGEEKDLVFRSSDLFVLPTFSENFGVVIAEALSYGIPVITTRGAPWSDLEKFGCGWWIDVGVSPLVEALRSAMGLPSIELKNMGIKGHSYVQRYNWNEISKEMESIYRWLLNDGVRPSCVCS